MLAAPLSSPLTLLYLQFLPGKDAVSLATTLARTGKIRDLRKLMPLATTQSMQATKPQSMQAGKRAGHASSGSAAALSPPASSLHPTRISCQIAADHTAATAS